VLVVGVDLEVLLVGEVDTLELVRNPTDIPDLKRLWELHGA
jgi:hypothetical protein